MNKAEHTPGPWIVGAGINSDSVMAGDYFVATCHDAAGAYSTNETLAENACLIAAAPELLEALAEIVSTADSSGWANLDAGFTKARAAIAKATGQKQ